MPFQSTKTFGHEVGLSCCFRQHKAKSHCRLLHGYAISVKLTFTAAKLDEHNWVVDFGSFKGLKALLEATFDHKLLVAQDDPEKNHLLALQDLGIAEVVILESVGCEAFAKVIADHCMLWILDQKLAPRVWLYAVEVREHGANSAIYYP
jgi:6-pyruvoyltetrahydropterin/6-carboxytetrahydropterin synthase